MMNCQQVTRLLSDAQEHKLSLNDRAAIKIHVMMCSGCRNFGQQMDTLRDIADAYAKGAGTEPEDDYQPPSNNDDSRG